MRGANGPRCSRHDPSCSQSLRNGILIPSARALYLFRDGKDTMYRLHGTPEWDSIGKNASSGCVRFMNQDIIDLYSRVNGPAQVFVRPNLSAAGKIMAVSSRTAEPIDAGVPKDAEFLK
ncbi:L,D-transpeptidase [Mesorhizobium sp. Ld1326N3]|uniref:L,D-transpeptidase n=1 Tax=Mesorhizobium salmacidum TaxID=3015171 RepID=A0ABU8KPU7_9HYPH